MSCKFVVGVNGDMSVRGSGRDGGDRVDRVSSIWNLKRIQKVQKGVVYVFPFSAMGYWGQMNKFYHLAVSCMDSFLLQSSSGGLRVP